MLEKACRTRAGPIGRDAAREGAKLAKGGAKGKRSAPHRIAAVRPIRNPYHFDSATSDAPARGWVFAPSWRALRLCARPLVRSAGCRRASASADIPVPSLQCLFAPSFHKRMYVPSSPASSPFPLPSGEAGEGARRGRQSRIRMAVLFFPGHRSGRGRYLSGRPARSDSTALSRSPPRGFLGHHPLGVDDVEVGNEVMFQSF